MWLCCEGFSDGLSRFASSISLKPALPTFLASWERQKTEFITCALVHKVTAMWKSTFKVVNQPPNPERRVRSKWWHPGLKIKLKLKSQKQILKAGCTHRQEGRDRRWWFGINVSLFTGRQLLELVSSGGINTSSQSETSRWLHQETTKPASSEGKSWILRH